MEAPEPYGTHGSARPPVVLLFVKFRNQVGALSSLSRSSGCSRTIFSNVAGDVVLECA